MFRATAAQPKSDSAHSVRVSATNIAEEIAVCVLPLDDGKALNAFRFGDPILKRRPERSNKWTPPSDYVRKAEK